MIVQPNLDREKMLLSSISEKTARLRRFVGSSLALAALLLCQQAASASVAAAETAFSARQPLASLSARPLHAAAYHEGAGGAEAAIGMAANPELGWLLETRGPRLSRSTGRHPKDEAVDSRCRADWLGWLWRQCRNWMLAGLLLVVSTGASRAEESFPGGPFVDGSLAPSAEDVVPADIRPASAAKRQSGRQNVPYDRSNETGDSAGTTSRRPYWGSPHIVVADAADYPRPSALENNDPSSFWYSLRPNIFNVPVSDEWDFYNIINTDRPDFTDAVYSVGRGVTIVETGYTFHKINDAQTHISTRQLPESLVRYGVTDEFELRLKWNGYLMTDFKDVASGMHASQFGGQDTDLGFKWELLQQRGWRPMTTIVSGVLVPTGTRGISANALEPHANLLFGWGLRRWLYLKWQSGVDILRVSNAPVSVISSVVPGFVVQRSGQESWHESLSLLTQWSKRVGAFHEWFAICNTGGGADTRASHFLDMGVYLYATPNIQFDARIGKRISDRVNEVFTGAGFSARW
jgi:hypothetical protein